jgi:hypothetical protein
MHLRALAVSAAALGLTAAPAAGAVRVAVPQPGELTVAVVTTKQPPAGSKRAARVLRVANAGRLSRRVAVYAGAAPSCSNATRRRFTAVVVVTRRRPDAGGAGRVVLDGVGKGAAVRSCGSYPLRSRFAGAAIRRLRCDRLTARPPRSVGPLLLGSDATCIGAVQRRLSTLSPWQLPLNLDMGTLRVEGPPAARNITATARPAGEPRPGVFRYAMTVLNATPAPYPGVATVAGDRTPDTLTFAALGGEESPNVVGGPQDLVGYACRVELSPGLPGSLTCRAPHGRELAARLDFELDFDAPLPEGPSAGIEITLPRYGNSATTYDIDVTR